MGLENLYSVLYEHQIAARINSKLNRIELTGSKQFDQYISVTEGGKLKVEVYLANKSTADSITKEDFRECMKVRDDLVDKLNSLSLPVEFNFFGESE